MAHLSLGGERVVLVDVHHLRRQLHPRQDLAVLVDPLNSVPEGKNMFCVPTSFEDCTNRELPDQLCLADGKEEDKAGKNLEKEVGRHDAAQP